MGFSVGLDIPGIGRVGATSGSPPTDFTQGAGSNQKDGDASLIAALLDAVGIGGKKKSKLAAGESVLGGFESVLGSIPNLPSPPLASLSQSKGMIPINPDLGMY